MTENWLNLLRIASATTALIVTIEVLWRTVGEPRGWPHEAGRKAHHIGIGLIGAFLNQWLLSRWSGFVLGLSFGSLLLLGYRLGVVRSLFDARPQAPKVEAIRVWSHAWVGPAAFSIAVSTLSILFWNDIPIYRASMLILALGDSSAAIFGLVLGRHCYRIFGARRSLEGNMALVVLATAVCLASLAGRGAEAMLFSWLMGIFLCLAETISPMGFDNITLPMAAAAVLSLLRTPGSTGPLVVDTNRLELMALVTAAAAVFTVAHLKPRLRSPAVLAMGAAVLLVAQMGEPRALAILAGYVAMALAAGAASPAAEPAATAPARDILVQLVPCAAFVALSAATGNTNFLVGSLASLTVVGRRCWAAIRPASSSPAPAVPHTHRLALESLSGMGAAWAALVLAGGAAILFDLGRVEASVLAILLASAAGGLVSWLLQRSMGALEPAEEPLIHQLAPALLALTAVPIVSLLLVGLSG
ncbi:MAG: hypothetical protein HY303_17090 [Candidatus Wallbacteria bacterium]|nr:hypothetical protein [Candidatus Wallbacteria bacterium]